MIAMVNTRNSYNAKSIPLHRKRDYEFIFEDYELAFPKVQLAKNSARLEQRKRNRTNINRAEKARN